jgi:hypothetical protein
VSKPKNSAARNAMRPFERQCYDWGWADNEERILRLIQDGTESMGASAVFAEAIIESQFKLEDGTYVVSLDDVWEALNKHLHWQVLAIEEEGNATDTFANVTKGVQ